MAFLKFLRTTLVGGLLIILPVGLVAAAAMKAVSIAREVLSPIVGWLPQTLYHPTLVAALLVVALCFFAGILVRTTLARSIGRVCERGFLEKIPGYTMFRTLTRRIGGHEDEKLGVALVTFDDHEVIGFIMERLPDGRCAVFMPSAPAASSGSLMIVAADRLRILDVAPKKAFSCFSHWGTGSAALLAEGART